jgi:hypothetical protein
MTRRSVYPRTLLDEMHHDRAALSERAKMPRWFSPAVGLVLASWVGSPAVGPDRDSESYIFGLMAVLLLIEAARRSTGVRHAGLGVRGWSVGMALLVSAMGLYSASLALVSLNLSGWVIAPTLAMFGAGWMGVHAMNEAARETLRGVR